MQRIAVAPLASDAWLDHPVVPIQVDAPGASTLALRTSTGITRVPLHQGHLEGWVPAEVESVRVEAPGHAASDWVDPADAASLSLGGPGRLELTVTSPTRPVALHWTHEDGRTGMSQTVANEIRINQKILQISDNRGSE